nr:type II toxin-antitoxin system VapC family toxin [Ferroglobus placidus]
MDVNVFVYWLCGHPSFGEKAKNWIKRIDKEGNYLTSTLTLYETLVIVAGLTNKSLTDEEFVKTVVESFTSIGGLKIEPLVKEDFAKALDIMSDFGLDFEDSLHLAVAKRKNAEEIISNDSDFDKTGIKRVF